MQWHLPQELWDEIGIHYDTQEDFRNLITHKVDYIKLLEDLYLKSPEKIKSMQDRLRRIAFNIQYSLIEDITVGRKSSTVVTTLPGLMDAYDISMNNVLHLHSGRMSHDCISEYLSCKYNNGKNGVKIQTADNCNRTYTNKDPYYPPATYSPFFKGTVPIITYKT